MNSWAQSDGAPSVRSAMLVAKRNATLIEADNAAVGDSHSEDVAGEIAQHGFIAVSPSGAVDNPSLGPGRLGQYQIGTALGQRCFEFAAHELGQGRERNQKA